MRSKCYRVVLLSLISMLFVSVSYAHEIEMWAIRSSPYQGPPSYWTNYAKMLQLLNEDRRQTLNFHANRNGIRMSEGNPLLGKDPSPGMVNRYFIAVALIPVVFSGLPDWVQASIAESVAMIESMTIDRNNRDFNGEDVPMGNKFAIVLSFRIE